MLELPWYAFALLGAVVVACSSILEKKTLLHEDPLHVSGSIALVGALFSFPFLFLVEWSVLTLDLLALLYALSLLAIVAFSITSIAMRQLEAGETSSILAITPAATALLAYLFLNEVLSARALAGIFTIVVGLVLLELPRLRHITFTSSKLPFVGVAFLAVLLYAIGSLTDRFLLTSYPIRPFDFVVLVQSGMALNFLMLSCARRNGGLVFGSLRHEPFKVIGIAALLFLSRLLHTQAIAMTYVALASALKRTSVIFTILIAGPALGERHIVHHLIAACFIIAGAVLIIV